MNPGLFPIRFGTDGWRALIAQDFTTANVARVAQAHAQYLLRQGQQPRVVIGYDTRFAGRLFAETTARVMAANGLEVYLTRDLVFNSHGNCCGLVLAGDACLSNHRIFCVLLDHLYYKGLRSRVSNIFATTQLIKIRAACQRLAALKTLIGFKYVTDAMPEGDLLINDEESRGSGAHGP